MCKLCSILKGKSDHLVYSIFIEIYLKPILEFKNITAMKTEPVTFVAWRSLFVGFVSGYKPYQSLNWRYQSKATRNRYIVPI